ncbi:MAG: nuclear transport factor 2 family protein [Deltaproteobacteria bacterium]|nr:nuclear transport factor 2 family protein [Deltaproteobacteria bacterium]
MTASEQVRLATVEEHVRGENARDMDVVMSTFSDGTHTSVVYNGIPTTGHAKIRRSYEIRLNALPDFRFEVTQRHFTADSLIAEHVLHFTNKKGQPVGVPMCIVYCFDEAGKLSEERVYIDEARMIP